MVAKVIQLEKRAEAAEAALATMIEQKEYFRQCWEAAEAALAERDKPCVWVTRLRKRGGGTMLEPTCERAVDDFGFISAMETAPTRFCPNCGHPIEVQP